MNRIDKKFKELKKEKKKAFIVYITTGDPDIKTTERLIKECDKCGVDILELGIPFSDPTADGPTIQFSSQKALEKGTSLSGMLTWVKSLRSSCSLPIVFMGYCNPIMNYGIARFARDAAAAGVSGLIVPDMIPEEAKSLGEALKKHHIHMIYLVAPTTPPHRLKMIAKKTRGFLYAVSVAGVTGARKGFSSKTAAWLASLRKLTSTPVCVGFGISRPEHIRQLKKSVDGFIVGSALIDILRKNSSQKAKEKIAQFIGGLSKECFYGR